MVENGLHPTLDIQIESYHSKMNKEHDQDNKFNNHIQSSKTYFRA